MHKKSTILFIVSFFGSILCFVWCLCLPTPISAQVVINEFYPKSGEWVEFYNSGDTAVDLSGYYFDDDNIFDSDSGNSNKISLKGLLNSHSLCYLGLSSFLNDSGDTPTLFEPNGDIIDTYNYTSSLTDKSYSRVPDGGTWESNQVPSKVDISCDSLFVSTPSPSPTSTLSPSSTPAAYKSVYKINSPKDNSGLILSGVQIFVDGVYIHHEDSEIIEFFNGHECYLGVNCDLGIHTISLRKTGYSSWEDSQNFTAGINLEANPVLPKESSSTSTPVATTRPTNTPTPKPTKSPIPTEKSATASAVLGIQSSQNEAETPLPETSENEKKKLPFLPFVLVVVGLGFIAISFFSIIRRPGKNYTDESEKENSKIY